MSSKHISAKKKQIREYAVYVADQMLLWAKKRYNLNEKILDVTLIASFNKNRLYSYGGWHKTKRGVYRPYLNLCFANCIKFKPQMISEYDWYKDDPIIGQRLAATWKYYVRFLISHEISHIIQFSPWFLSAQDEKDRLRKRFGRSKLSDEDHGEDFQKIYRILRRKYVNRAKKSVTD
jgi:hypothetical protein